MATARLLRLLRPIVKEATSKETEDDVDDDDDDDDDPYAYDYGYGNFKPTKFTGPIHNLMEKIPQHLQLLSIENILRADLAHRYQQCENKFKAKYTDKARKHDKEYVLTNTLGFHGTATNNMGSIIRSGLKVPGTDGVSVAHGSAYGVGIYLSPDPSYSLGYSSDTKTLLVCTVLLGRCLKLGDYTKKKVGSFDSVISPSGFEMVLFSADQVLPCFVIKLANKYNRQESSTPPQINGAYASSIGKAEREKETPEEALERAKKRAAKYLPFGYGPSNIILGVADSSDDEEDYGEYQEYRTGMQSDENKYY